MAVAELGYKIDSSGAVKAESDLDGMTSAAIRAEAAAKGLGKQSTVASANAAKFGKTMKSSTAQTANLGAQLNDIGVMLAAGQNPLQLAVQQGTQINQVFAQMGGGKQALQGLATGFMSMVNPMSLATIGIIAGGAALVQWGVAAVGAGDKSAKLEDDLASLDDVVAALASNVNQSHMSFAELRDDFGENALAAGRLYESMVLIRKLEAMDALAVATESVLGQFDGLVSSVESLNYVMTQTDVAAGVNTRSVKALSDEFGVTVDQALLLKNGIDGVNSAVKAPERVAAMQTLLNQIVATKNEAGQIPAALRPMALELARAVEQGLILDHTIDDIEAGTYDAAAATDGWASSMAGVLSYVNAISGVIASLGGKLIGSAAKQVQIDALRAGKSIAEAKMASQDFEAEQSAAHKRAMAGDNMFKRIAAEADIAADAVVLNRNRILSEEMAMAAEREALASKTSGGGGGGGKRGGGGKSDTYQRDLDALIQSLQTERETVDLWYQESQTILNDRRALELMTAAEHNEAKLALENEYSSRVVDIKQQEAAMVQSAAGGMYGELSSLLSSFGQKSKAAAVAALAVNTALRIREVIQNTAAASMKAMAELGPIAGPPAAAKIAAFGKVQAGLVLANAALSVGSMGGGGGGGGGGSSASAPSAGSSSSGGSATSVVVQLEGSMASLVGPMMDEIVKNLQDEHGDGVVIGGFTT